MGKAIKSYPIIIYLLVITLIFLGVPIPSSAQETMSIVTYYPAPFGVYQEMRVTTKMIFDENSEVWVRPVGAPADGSADIQVMSFLPTGVEFKHNLLLTDDGDPTTPDGDIIFRDPTHEVSAKHMFATAEEIDGVLYESELFIVDQLLTAWSTALICLDIFVWVYPPLIIAIAIVKASQKLVELHKAILESIGVPEWWPFN